MELSSWRDRGFRCESRRLGIVSLTADCRALLIATPHPATAAPRFTRGSVGRHSRLEASAGLGNGVRLRNPS